MANPLGTAAYAIDGTIATLQPQVATYLGAGGSARVLIELLQQAIMDADPSHKRALVTAMLAGKKGRPSPLQTNGQSLVKLTRGAIYP